MIKVDQHGYKWLKWWVYPAVAAISSAQNVVSSAKMVINHNVGLSAKTRNRVVGHGISFLLVDLQV